MTTEELKQALLQAFETDNPYESGAGLEARIISDMDIWTSSPEVMIEWIKRTLPADAKLLLANGEPLIPRPEMAGNPQQIVFTSKKWDQDPEGRFATYDLNQRMVIPSRSEDRKEVSVS